MEPSVILSTMAGLGYMLAYLDYNRGVSKGVTEPNGATWAIWSAIAVVSTGSYFAATGDFWKSLLPTLNIMLCTGTFVLALIAGKFKKFDVTDWIALGVGLIAATVWIIYKSATYANLIVQFAILVGFIPTWWAIWETPSCEHPRPWSIWTVSYCISLIVVILRWKNQWIDLVYPINCIVLHASIPILCSLRSRVLVPRETFEQELADVQHRIQEISCETDNREELNARIVSRAVDRDSRHEQERRAGRQEDVLRNRRLIDDLQKQEAHLKRKLGVA